jgi:hypothetical protein
MLNAIGMISRDAGGLAGHAVSRSLVLLRPEGN